MILTSLGFFFKEANLFVTGFIPRSSLSIVSTMVMWETSQWKEYCAECWLKELQESMDRCTDC